MLKVLHILSEESSVINNAAGARILISAICVWSWTGFYTLILKAAIDNVNESAIEAAGIDGASTAKIFRKIILPNIYPVLIMTCVLSSCSYLSTVYWSGVDHKRGREFSTYTSALYLYRKAFVYVSEFGYAFRYRHRSLFRAVLFVCLVMIYKRKANRNET